MMTYSFNDWVTGDFFVIINQGNTYNKSKSDYNIGFDIRIRFESSN